jgi:hypothetical protein
VGTGQHSFSRIYSGAFYDVLDGISDANRAAGMSPAQALTRAGQEAWTLFVGLNELAPYGNQVTFSELGTALIQADQSFNDSRRSALITQVMTTREILAPGPGILSRSVQPVYSGEVITQTHTLGVDFGPLAGVKVETKVDVPAGSSFTAIVPVTNGVEKDIKQLLAQDQVLFTDSQTPTLAEVIKPDGTAYTAYVTTNQAGEKVIKGIPIVAEASHPNRERVWGGKQLGMIFQAATDFLRDKSTLTTSFASTGPSTR